VFLHDSYAFHKNGEPPMKIIVLLTLFITIGCILATGCIGQIKKDNGNGNATISPTITFSPVVITTSDSPIPMNVTVNVTKLKGPLRVSIGGYPADLPVTVDNQSVGMVTRAIPLDLMIDEGNHTVKVCVGVICENETVEIVFAKKSFIDFEERLRKDIEFPNPTARINDYYRSGNGVAVVVEFINPTSKDLSMSAEVNIGYSFINDRNDQRGGESTRGKASALVRAGQRMTTTLNLNFAPGYAYMFDPPVLGQTTTY
jgi:hypothetical protein